MKNPTHLRYLSAVNAGLTRLLDRSIADPEEMHVLVSCQGVIARLLVADKGRAEFVRRVAEGMITWREMLADLPATESFRYDLQSKLDTIESDLGNSDAEALEKIQREFSAILEETLSDAGIAEFTRSLLDMDYAVLSSMEKDFATLTNHENDKSNSDNNKALSAAQNDALLNFLRETANQTADMKLKSVSALAGGFSKATLKVELVNTKDFPSKIIVRHDRADSSMHTSVMDEFALLQLLHANGVKVPKPYFVDSGEVFGLPAMIVELVDGSVIADGHNFHIPPNGLEPLALSLAEQLAKLHAVPIEHLPDAIPGRDRDNRDVLSEEIRSFRDIWEQADDIHLATNASLKWLETNLDLCGNDKVLTHGDIRFHNILVADNDISALLDWELASLAHPALDVAYTYQHVSQMIEWDRFLARYRECGGVSIDSATLKFYILRCELLTSSYLTRFMTNFVSGNSNAVELAYAGSHLRQRNIYLLAKRLQFILSGKEL